MAGVLSFALGLDASRFSSGMDRAAARLLAFISVGKLASATFQGVWGAISKGGELQDLSNETTIAVGRLYSLQEAMKVVGGEAGSIPSLMRTMGKSIAGVDEAGEKTDKLFNALGINMQKLRGKDAVTQIETIATALNKLSPDQAQFAAAKIFGRGGASSVLRIARDMEGFKDAIRQTAAEAKVFERTAAAFDKIGDTISLIKSKAAGMFAGIAEGIAPALQMIADFFNNADVVGFGERIGTVLAGITQAFREGKLTELIAESVLAGFSIAIDLLPGLFQKIGVFLIKIFEAPLKAVSAVFDMWLQTQMGRLAMIPGLNSALGLKGFKPQSAGQIWDEHMNNPLVLGMTSLDELSKGADDGLKAGIEAAKKRLAELGGTFEGFASRLPRVTGEVKKNKATLDISGVLQKDAKKTEFTNVEKLGFIFGRGGPSIATEHARNTAENTRRTNTILTKTNEMLGKIGTPSFANS